jgi:tetratricopeptide (TPR) repeat protein
MPKCLFTAALFLTALASDTYGQANDDERKAYLAKRAAEKAAAEQTVKELTVRDYATVSADDFIRLALAYNELGDNRLALDAVSRVSDDVLAQKKQLDLKAICFHNVSSGDDKTARIRELAFIDRCLDRSYPNQGVWLWRKAKVVCQSSVSLAIHTRGDVIGEEARVIDREQYEYAFELLERAFKTEPNLFNLAGVGHEFMWGQDFPLLSKELRFKELMKRHAPY